VSGGGYIGGCSGLRNILADADVTTALFLDWFHIGMRLQHLKQIAGGLSRDNPSREAAKAVIVGEVERLHWRLWNGKATNARISIDRVHAVMHHSNRNAVFEFDKLVCRIYTLDHLRDPQSQRDVHRSQNRIEAYYQLRAAIAQVGGKKQLIGRLISTS
jgi:Tn3 transposase DDE domain